jgi:hypothetical protein
VPGSARARTVTAVPRFLKAKRRLPEPAQIEVDTHVLAIRETPLRGETKTGALRGVRVLKFTVTGQRYLLAYRFFPKPNVLELIDVAPHENFYRDLQKYLDAR